MHTYTPRTLFILLSYIWLLFIRSVDVKYLLAFPFEIYVIHYDFFWWFCMLAEKNENTKATAHPDTARSHTPGRWGVIGHLRGRYALDGCMDGWMDGWIYLCMPYVSLFMDIYIYGSMYVCIPIPCAYLPRLCISLHGTELLRYLH